MRLIPIKITYMRKLYLLFVLALVAAVSSSATPVKKSAGSKVNNSAAVEIKADAAMSRADGAPEGEWTSLGTGLMTDEMVTYLFKLRPLTWEVEILQSVENPNFYRVVAPYGEKFAEALLAQENIRLDEGEYDNEGKCMLTIDTTDPEDVYFPKTYIGCDWGYGEMYIGIPSSAKVYFRDGIFGAPPRGVAVGDDDGAVAANISGRFRIVLPGVEATDFALEITPSSPCYPTLQASNSITIGGDIASIKYTIGYNLQEDEMVSYYKQVAARGYDYTMEPELEYEMSGERKETIIMVGFDYNGNEVAYAWASYYYIPDETDDWMSLGEADFTDDAPGVLISNMEPVTYKVEIQEHKYRKGYYRLVNPYDSKYPYHTNPDRYHTDHNHYVYINAEDPDLVYIEESPMGCDWGYGAMRISSYVQYFLDAGYDMEEIVELEMGGTLENNVISMPEESVLFSMLGYESGDWYESNLSGEFSVVIPKSGVEEIISSDSENAAPVYYNLQGIRVEKPSKGEVYIMRKGSTVRKVVM